MKIYPSLISADLLNLKQVIASLDPHCNGYHLDVMDGHFVPNITWGPAFINAIRQATNLPLHIHLMVDNPTTWIDRLNLSENDAIIFHHEALPNELDQHKLITKLHQKKLLAGVALNPETPVSNITHLIDTIDIVLLMSVRPGFSGQSFLQDVTKKIQPLLAMKKQSNKIITIGMDGGINAENITALTSNIDFVGVAAAIFHQPDPINALKNLYNLAKK